MESIDYNILISKIIDLITTSIPVLSVVIGSYLTYKFTQKDKIRDILYSRKVDAYSKLVILILKVKKDFQGNIANLYGDEVSPWNESIGPLSISNEFTNNYSESILFLSTKMTKKIDSFINELRQSSSLTLNHSIDSDLYKKEYLIENCEHILIVCDSLIEDLHKEIGLQRIVK